LACTPITESMTALLKTLLEDADLRDRLGGEGAEAVRHSHSEASVTDAVLLEYERP
jgi:hypothetical protein